MLQPPTATTDDDITEPFGKNRSQNGDEEREFHVKWQMKAGHDLPTIKRQLYNLIITLLIEFPNQVALIDRKQREWYFSESEDEEKFQKDFEKASIQLHPIKNKQQKVARWISIMTFRASTNIKEWKDNDRFYASLSEAETYLFPHHFGKDDWEVTSIGFLKEIHVVHYPKEELYKNICDLLKRDNPTSTVPIFQIIPQRITTTDKKASTKAFTIQCLKSEAIRLGQLLTQGSFRHPPNQIFVPFKYKSKKPDVFLQCIRQQNDVYYKTWVIKMEGVQREAMEQIKSTIMNQPGVFQVVPTKRTDSIGEWKIMVDQSKCAYVHRNLTSMWQQLVATIPEPLLKNAPDSYPSPRISSKKARDYQDTDSDEDSYGSLLTTGTDMSQTNPEDTTLNELPDEYQFPTYAQAASGSAVSLDSTQISSPTTSAHSAWQKEKQELEAALQKQEAQMAKQAELIEKIQADLLEKISRSHDIEEKLAQAIDLAHSRDARHEEMMEKFEQLMRRQEDQSQAGGSYLSSLADGLPTTPSRSTKPYSSPPNKKANTNASPNRTVYAVFKQPPTKNQSSKPSFMSTYLKNHRPPPTSPLRLMDIDEGSPPPPPGAKSGQKIE